MEREAAPKSRTQCHMASAPNLSSLSVLNLVPIEGKRTREEEERVKEIDALNAQIEDRKFKKSKALEKLEQYELEIASNNRELETITMELNKLTEAMQKLTKKGNFLHVSNRMLKGYKMSMHSQAEMYEEECQELIRKKQMLKNTDKNPDIAEAEYRQ